MKLQILSLLLPLITALKTYDGKTPTILISHRGDPTLQPEETRGSYEVASLLGSKFLEPDLVLSKDGHVVCFHDLDLGTISNVAELFPSRITASKEIWNEDRYITLNNTFLVNDFTLKELKTLRIHQREKGVRSSAYDGVFGILTFEEYIDIAVEFSKKLGWAIGMVPELKHPRYFKETMDLPSRYFEDSVLQILTRKGFPAYGNSDLEHGNGFTGVVVQCFEQDPLEYFKSKSDFHRMLLVETNVKFLTPLGLKEAKLFADSVSFWKEYATVGIEADTKYTGITYDAPEIEKMGGFIAANEIVQSIHNEGMRAIVYTFYTSTEESHSYCAVKCVASDRKKEMEYFFEMGADALFVENFSEAKGIQQGYFSKVSGASKMHMSVMVLVSSLVAYLI